MNANGRGRRPQIRYRYRTAAIAAWSLEIATTSFALDAFHLPHGIAAAMAILFGVNLDPIAGEAGKFGGEDEFHRRLVQIEKLHARGVQALGYYPGERHLAAIRRDHWSRCGGDGAEGRLQ